jgi:hypothetical protein
MWQQSQIIGEQRFHKDTGDRIEVRVGQRVIEVASCRLYYAGSHVGQGRERIALAERRMTGYVSGKALAPVKQKNRRQCLSGVSGFRLAIRASKRAPGDQEWTELECRVVQRRPEFWSFNVLAEVIYV